MGFESKPANKRMVDGSSLEDIEVDVEYQYEWRRAHYGRREGGMQMEPDEPAGWGIEITSVTWNGVDITEPYLDYRPNARAESNRERLIREIGEGLCQ